MLSSYKNRIKLLVASGNFIERKGLCSAFVGDSSFIECKEVATEKQMSGLLRTNFFDAIVLDTLLCGGEKKDFHHLIRNCQQGTGIILYSDSYSQHDLFEYMQMGVMGFVQKSEADEVRLRMALQLVADNNRYFSPGIRLIPENKVHNGIKVTKQKELLTMRENEIIVNMCKEMTSEEIADKLCIEVSTVKTHRNNIMKKLKVKSVVGVVAYAVRNRLIDFDFFKNDFQITNQ